VLKFNTKIIKQFSSNTSYFIVCEATSFGPYMTNTRLFVIILSFEFYTFIS